MHHAFLRTHFGDNVAAKIISYFQFKRKIISYILRVTSSFSGDDYFLLIFKLGLIKREKWGNGKKIDKKYKDGGV